jgi:hypothetical protein
MVSPDLIFSYWIIVWYILYYLRIVFINPKFALICGLIVNLIILLSMIYYHTKNKLLFSFFVLIFVSKLIPLFTIWKTKICLKDIHAFIFLFSIYLIWAMVINKKKTVYFTNQMSDLILYNKSIYPGITFINKQIL